MNIGDFHLVGHSICPYVQRVEILSREMGLKLLRTDIDIDKKPKDFLDYSPTGKVPLLVIDNGGAVFGSSVICEFLIDIGRGDALPADPRERAMCRSWIEYGDEVLTDIADLIYRDKTYGQYAQRLANLKTKLSRLGQELSNAGFFLGQRLLLVDMVFATIFRYLPVLFAPNLLKELKFALPSLSRYIDELLGRPSVKLAVPDNYEELLVDLIKRQDSFLSIKLKK